jgi:hypothetical protein
VTGTRFERSVGPAARTDDAMGTAVIRLFMLCSSLDYIEGDSKTVIPIAACTNANQYIQQRRMT